MKANHQNKYRFYSFTQTSISQSVSVVYQALFCFFCFPQVIDLYLLNHNWKDQGILQ